MVRATRILLTAIVAVIIFGFATYLLREPTFCNGLVNPWEKTAAFVVTVPDVQTATFDQQITSFMDANALGIVKGSYSSHEPLGEMTPYTHYQVEGCDGTSYIWSGNDVKGHDYLVTFHRNRMFGDRTPRLRDQFLSEFRRRFQVRPYVDWRS